MKSMTICTKCVFVNKTTIVLMANVNFQLLVDLIPTGMESNVNAIQDSSMLMVNVFLSLLPPQSAQLMLALTE